MAYNIIKINELRSKTSDQLLDSDNMIISRAGIGTYKSSLEEVKKNFNTSFKLDDVQYHLSSVDLSVESLNANLSELSNKTADLSDVNQIKVNRQNIGELSSDVEVIQGQIDQFKKPIDDTGEYNYHLIKLGYNETSQSKTYKVQLDAHGNAYVNVPWTSSSGTTANDVSIALDQYKLSIDSIIPPKINTLSTTVLELSTEVKAAAEGCTQIYELSNVSWSIAREAYGYAMFRRVVDFSLNSQTFESFIGATYASEHDDYVLRFESNQSATTTNTLINGKWKLYRKLAAEVEFFGMIDNLVELGVSLTTNAPSTSQFCIGDEFDIQWQNNLSCWTTGSTRLSSVKQGDIGELSSSISAINTTKLDSTKLSAEEWTITYKDADGNITTVKKEIAMFTSTR